MNLKTNKFYKMNTVKIGDKFEDKSYDLIENAIKNNELGVSQSTAKVYRKKGYYSKDREKDIIFDLSIEIWPQKAKRYTLLYLIECKSSNSKKVPVDDVEEFYSKIIQVAGVNVKGVMISDNSFQTGAINFAKNKGMMLIEVDKENNYSIRLHRIEKDKQIESKKSIDETFIHFIKKVLGLKKVKGLKRLSAAQIENIALPILQDYNGLQTSIKIEDFTEYLKSKYGLKFNFFQNLETVNGKKITGFFDLKTETIFVDNSIVNTKKFPFVFGHELGHFFLHSKLEINQEQYNDFEDSEYNFFTDRFDLINDKNWIEWQANKFGIALFLPKELFLVHLIAFRRSIGISRPEHIYLDDQMINKKDYWDTVDYLSRYFSVSKTVVKFRIEDLGLITYAKPNDLRNIARNIFFDKLDKCL